MNIEKPNNLLPLEDIFRFVAPPELNRLIATITRKLVGLEAIEQLYRTCSSAEGHYKFVHQLLKQLNIRYLVHREDLQSYRSKGATIVVANHPFGGIDAIVMCAVLLGLRKDVRVLGNSLLLRIPQLKDLVIGVDPFGGKGAEHRNVASLREAIHWLKQGGMLMVFPAGEVSHLHLKDRNVYDSEWNSMIARMAEISETQIIPAYFHGRNSLLFQLLGLLHPTIRTALLPRELIKKQNQTVRVAFGTPIQTEALQGFGDAPKVVQYLRHRTYALKSLCTDKVQSTHSIIKTPAHHLPVVEAIDPRLIVDEIAALPKDRCLVEHGKLKVYFFKADEAPWTLQEIGRLREVTFRSNGEGTGKSSDIDLYDAYYHHLVIWNSQEFEIIGAYRLGLTDQILTRANRRPLYTQTLFKYKRPLLDFLNPAIELGRSFVRDEYRRDFAPLLLMWKGIGQLVANNPKYRMLFGPVSITNEYQTISQQLMVDFLKLNRFDCELARLVKPRRPFKDVNPGNWWENDCGVETTISAVSNLISEIETDSKGVPILIKHYLKLGGKFLGFNLDEQFSNTLDGLILVDLYKTDIRLLKKYMGTENARSYVEYHDSRNPAGSKAS